MKSHEMLSFIKSRFSPRAYSEKDILQSELDMIFEAATWAPSAMNAQPWRFLYARSGTEAYNKILSTLTARNKLWAKSAPVLITTMITKNFEHDKSPYFHAMHDLGMALGNMNIQALSQNIYLHYMSGFDAQSLTDVMAVPSELQVISVIAAGYLGSDDRIPADLAESTNNHIRNRNRKPVNSIAFNGSFTG